MSSCGIRHVLLRPLPLLLAHYNHNHDQKVQSQEKSKPVKGCEFQDLALLCACADGILVFDRCRWWRVVFGGGGGHDDDNGVAQFFSAVGTLTLRLFTCGNVCE